MQQTNQQMADYFDQCARQGEMADWPPDQAAKLKQCLTRWNIRPHQCILEPGCGRGRLTAVLAPLVGPEGRIVACDLSGEMIRRARELPLPDYVEFHHAAVEDLALLEASFDHVIALHVFPHLLDQPRVLADWQRTLKPGGRLWIQHLKSRQAVNQTHEDAGAFVRAHKIPDPPRMRRLAQEAGFHVIEIVEAGDEYRLTAEKPID